MTEAEHIEVAVQKPRSPELNMSRALALSDFTVVTAFISMAFASLAVPHSPACCAKAVGDRARIAVDAAAITNARTIVC
jgi:hypothetical protein